MCILRKRFSLVISILILAGLFFALGLFLPCHAGDNARYMNPRFSFRIICPEGWKRMESQNADGVTLTPPGVKNVQILAFGGYNVMENTLAKEAKEREITGVKKIKQGGLDGLSGKIKGGRAVILLREKKDGQVFYGIYLYAPESKMKDYLPLFQTVVKSFKPLDN